MAEAQLINLMAIANTVPIVVDPSIDRGNVLDTIDTIFEAGTELILVEGEEGIGKTILLYQFVARHPENAISLFIRPASRWGYDPEIIGHDLCNQLSWILNRKELSGSDFDIGFLRSFLYQLQRRIRRRIEHFYFVIDGLHEIPPEDEQMKDHILNMLPFGLQGFHFLISSESDQSSLKTIPGVKFKTFPVTGFIFDETVRYFKDLTTNTKALWEFHQTCKGIPGYLAALRRILQTGLNEEKLLEEMPTWLPDLFDLEWLGVTSENDSQTKVLAVLAHDRKRHIVPDLARALGLPTEDVFRSVSRLSFVVVDPQTQEVSFISEAFRRFATTKLAHLKKDVTEWLITDLLHDPDSDNALALLPTYYDAAGRFDDLLTYLSPEHFTKMMESSQSLIPVNQKAELGVQTAKQLHRDGDLVRFTINRSTLTELAGSQIWRSEVEARVSLGDYEPALALAQTNVLKEERLHLLAVIAKSKRQQGFHPEQELIDQIRQLYNQIDIQIPLNQAIDIAADLIYSIPELAVDLVEKATGAANADTSLDWAYATLSIAASGGANENTAFPDTLEKIRARIKDPGARTLSSAASLLMGDYSAPQVISEAEKIDKISDRLTILRLWVLENNERPDALEVVDHSLRLLISSTDYAPNARIFRQLATPLPFISDKKKAKIFVGRFDSQKDTIEKLGPTEDYIRLQLLLAQTLAKYDFEAAHNRAVDVFLQISELIDLSTKTACIAYFVSSLRELDPEEKMEIKDKLHTMAQQDLDNALQRLLAETADHYHATRNVIKAIAKHDPELAFSFSQKLNTVENRDRSFLSLVTSFSHFPLKESNASTLFKVISAILDPEIKDLAILRLTKNISRTKPQETPSVSILISIFKFIKNVRDTDERCRAYCLILPLLKEHSDATCIELSTTILNELRSDWESIDTGWTKVDLGFEIVVSLSEHFRQEAKNYLDLSQTLKEKLVLGSPSTASGYLACIHLSIRAFTGLLTKRVDKSDDLENISDLIDLIPSTSERLQLWSELALRSFANGRKDLCDKVVSEHIRPLWVQISTENTNYRDSILVNISPALFCAHQSTTLDEISKLPEAYKDEAYTKIANFILRKKPSTDPYDEQPGQPYSISYQDIIDLCCLLNLMNLDVSIFHLIRSISNSLAARQARIIFSQQQRADIIQRIKTVIDSKLPDSRNIKHEGYKITSEAFLSRILPIKHGNWSDLVERARKIPNTADRAFTLTMIACTIPARYQKMRGQAMNEGMQAIQAIPSILDRIKRYELFASLMLAFDLPKAKKCIERAFKEFIEVGEEDSESLGRKIIDMAYKIDPNFAASLASLSDQDPARRTRNKDVEKRIKTLQLRDTLHEKLAHSGDLDLLDKSQLPEIAWELLGSLNSNRIETVHIAHTRDLVQLASTFPLRLSYPIISWVIENAVRRYANTDQANTYLRPVFDATMLGTQLSEKFASHSSVQIKKVRTFALRPEEGQSILIKSRQRELAIEFIREWVEREVVGYLKVCDPYFGPSDLELLRTVLSVNPKCMVKILTSKKHQDQEKVQVPWENAYRTHWRIKILDQDPPDTEITVVGSAITGALPIHERWWITTGAGIRVGTSFNSLGVKRDSEISILSKDEAETREKEIDQYLHFLRKECNGEKLTYVHFTL